MHSLRFFSNAEVAERLAYPQLIEALRIGLAKPCSAPLRNCHALPAQASLLQMPVWQAGAGIGVKLVTVFPGNGARGLPAVAAVFALFDGEDGRPLALLEASELTARRTACSSALAADYLARDDARRLLVVGCGTLAAHMVRAHACVRDYRHIDIGAAIRPRPPRWPPGCARRATRRERPTGCARRWRRPTASVALPPPAKRWCAAHG